MNGQMVMLLDGLRIELAGFSEKGPRTENQDVLTLSTFPLTGIVAIADGMGGERGGRVAAETALAQLLDAGPVRSVRDARAAMRLADTAVADRAASDEDRYGGMGCALAFLSLCCRDGEDPLWICGHVGDVRVISRAPDGTVRLETNDHSESFARWEAGEIALDDVARSIGSNRLRRSIGRGGEPDVTWIPVRPRWRYAIVSDGVSRAVGLAAMGDMLARRSAAAAGDAIRASVEASGADDNFSALVIRIGSAPHPDWPRRREPDRWLAGARSVRAFLQHLAQGAANGTDS
jgi:serine/threonine protein phosphatase PrpC